MPGDGVLPSPGAWQTPPSADHDPFGTRPAFVARTQAGGERVAASARPLAGGDPERELPPRADRAAGRADHAACLAHLDRHHTARGADRREPQLAGGARDTRDPHDAGREPARAAPAGRTRRALRTGRAAHDRAEHGFAVARDHVTGIAVHGVAAAAIGVAAATVGAVEHVVA